MLQSGSDKFVFRASNKMADNVLHFLPHPFPSRHWFRTSFYLLLPWSRPEGRGGCCSIPSPSGRRVGMRAKRYGGFILLDANSDCNRLSSVWSPWQAPCPVLSVLIDQAVVYTRCTTRVTFGESR